MEKTIKNIYKKGFEDRAIDALVMFISVATLVLTAYPFYYCIVISLNDGPDALRGGIYFWPRTFSLENYRAVFRISYIYNAFMISVMRTLAGTACTLLCTGFFAYSLSHKNLRFRRFYMIAMIFTMYFSGGLIPYYMTLRFLGLMNTFAVYIIPSLLNAFYTIIMISFFREIPDSLEEAAIIDGAGYMYIFFKIIIPVSVPLIATMALFIGVYHWNAWTDAAFFVTSNGLKTLSFVLISLINQTEAAAQLDSEMGALGLQQAVIVGETLRPAAMIVVVIPIIMVYPFLQRYFVKGIMLGSVKQ